MKLNLDCMRDILLTLEKCDLFETLDSFTLQEELTNHTDKDVLYACAKLLEADFITGDKIEECGSSEYVIVNVSDITYSGHEFLNSIRPETVWDKVKSAIADSGVSSIKAISEAAIKLGVSHLCSFLPL